MNYKKRTEAVLRRMEKENADWFLVSNLANIRYLSGFTGSYAVLLIHEEARYILTDGRYTEQVGQEVRDYQAVIQGQRKEVQAIREILGDCSSQTVWFEGDHLSVSRYSALCETIIAKSYVAKRGIVEQLRSVKDDDEIESLRNALRVAEGAFHKVLPMIRENMGERELAHYLLDAMWRGGAVKESFDPLVLFGARSSLCHGKPINNPLRKGDIVLMDFGCLMADGYNSDITRTLFFGQPSSDLKEMYACVKEANQMAENRLQAGMNGVQGDEFSRDVFRKAGRVEQFVHGLGHGVGLEIHESPRLSPLSENDLFPGNVVTVEPGLYIPGVGGVRIEDMVVIRENGCEVFNQSSKEMMIL